MMSKILPLSDTCDKLSYLTEGPAAGCLQNREALPVVMIHGVGLNANAWDPQIKALGKRYSVYALDMPGHGRSNKLPTGAQLADYVDWLGRALDDLGLARVNLVGHSMGALIAGGYAVTRGDRVARLALLNGVFRRGTQARLAVVSRARRMAQGHFDSEAPLQRWFETDERALRERVREWLNNADPEGYATAYSAFAQGDETYADRFSDLHCPFLALTGDCDLNSTPEMTLAMAEAVPRGRAVIIKNHRHMVNLTAPEKVNAALGEWLQIPIKQLELKRERA